MKRVYRIIVRGTIPDDLVDRISALHAMAFLESINKAANNLVQNSNNSSGDAARDNSSENGKKRSD